MEFPMVPTSAETVTKDWVARVLADEFGTVNTNVLVTNLEISAAVLRTDGFLSRMQRITAVARKKRNAEDTDGDEATEREFHLVAKLFPPGEVHQKLVRSMRAFEREIHVFTDYVQLVLAHQDQEPKIHPQFAKLYFAETGIDASCIVLEDLKHTGFQMNDKRRGMDFAHAKLCVEGEAKFAAVGFNAKQRIGTEEYLLLNGPLLLDPFNKNFGLMMDLQIFPGTVAFAKGQDRPDLVDRLESYIKRVKSPFSRFIGGLNRRGELAVFSHGDCWNNNYMFRYEKDNEGNPVPVEVKILDLQISRYSHPTGDLASFTLTNLPNEVRETRLDDLLRVWYTTFMQTVEEMQTPWANKSAYTYEAFLKDMDTAWEFGFLAACWLVPMIMSNEEDIPNFDTMKEDDMGKFFEDHEAKMERGVNEVAADRITGILEFGAAKGII